MSIKPADLVYNTMSVREWVMFQRKFDLLWQTVFNGGSTYTHRELLLDQDEYWIGLSVPEGKRVIIWDRGISLSGGRFTLDIYSGAFTGGTPFLRNPLSNEQALVPLSSTFNVNVTPDGTPTLVEYGYERVATDSGSKVSTSVLNLDNGVKVFKGPISAMLKLTRLTPQGGGSPVAFDVLFNYTAWEEDV